MKKILLFIMVLLTQTLAAQVYSGASDAFWLTFDYGELDKYKDKCKGKGYEIGYIRHYIGRKGESTYFKILIPSKNKAIDISKNNNISIEYNKGSYFKTQIHSVKVEKLSKPYAKERIYGTIVEFPIDKNELCSKKRLKNIYIERDCGKVYTIEVKGLWALYLNKEFNTHFTEAKERADEHKKNSGIVANKYDTPEHIKHYIEDNYPECSYSLTQLDTVYLPIRSIMLLQYSIIEAHEEFAGINMDKDAENSAHILEHGENILKEFRSKLEIYEDQYNNPQTTTDDEYDECYQRATVVLRSYEGVDTITLYTRVGEENFTEFDFQQDADDCHKAIQEFERLINRMCTQHTEEE